MRSAARSGWLWVGVMLAACLAGFSQRLTLNATHPGANAWDMAVPVQADLYLLAYLFVPVWILRLSVDLPTRVQETWLLRCGSRLRWLLLTGRSAAGQALGLLGAWLATGLVLAAGLPWATGWSHTADREGREVVLGSLQAGGLDPIAAWALQWLAYLGLLLVIFTVLAVTTLLTTKAWVRNVAAATVFVAMVFLIRGGLPVGDLMFVYQAAAAGEPAWLPVVAPLVVLALVVAGFAAVEAARRSTWLTQISRLGPTGAYLVVVVAGMITTAVNLGGELNLPDLLLASFYGFDTSQLNPGIYSYFLLTFSGFSLLYLVSAEQRLWPLYLLISIRSGSPRRWMLRAWTDIAVKAAALMTCLTLVAVVVVAAAGLPFGGPALGLRVFQFAVNGTLQLLVSTGITLLIAYLTRSRGAVLATIAVIAVVQTPVINAHQVLPLGLNAVGLATDWSTVLGFTAYLATATAATVGLSLAACSHHARHTLERLAA